MSIFYTNHFLRRLKRYYKKKPQLRQQVAKQVELLEKNPQHPSLRMHKLVGKRTQQLAIWIEGNLRITFIVEGEDYVLTDIITHDEY